MNRDEEIERTELLPCPFCGEPPDRIDEYRTHCINLECGMYVKRMNVEDWNRRAASRKEIVEEAFEGLLDQFVGRDYHGYDDIANEIQAYLAEMEKEK